MWQSDGKEYHFVRSNKNGMSTMLCGASYESGHQVPYIDRTNKVCGTCNDVSRLIHATVDDLKISLHYVNDLERLRIAHRLAKGKTIKKMIQAKITRIKKSARIASTKDLDFKKAKRLEDGTFFVPLIEQ